MANAIDAGNVSADLVTTIRKKYEHYGETEKLNKRTAVHDIRLLLAEIERLDSELFECEETFK